MSETETVNAPDWLKSDVEANDRIRALKAVTTGGRWFAEQEQDGEYTGPGDDPPGYAGEWYETGGILCDPDGEDPEGTHEAVGVFSAAYPRHEPTNTAWAIAAHNDDAEARYGRLLAEYRRLVDAVRLAVRFLPIFPEHASEGEWASDKQIRAAVFRSEGRTPETIALTLEAFDKDRDARRAAYLRRKEGGDPS
jgi:hypothetical protein